MDNFIQVYNKAASDEFCNQIIEWFENAQKQGMTLTRQEHDQVSKLSKEDTAAYLGTMPFIHTNKELVNEFNRVFWGVCYKDYAEKFSILQEVGPHHSYTNKIQKTQPGQGYHLWHCEEASRETSNRLLTWSLYLNDEFEAGETEFLYQQYRYKPVKGDIIIFPSAFTHTHRGNPPIGGNKYIMTGWIEY